MQQRPSPLHRLRTLCVAALAVVPAIAAHAADWRYREPQAEAPAQLSGFVTANDGSIWSWGQYGVYRSDSSGTQLVHRSTALFGMASRALADGSVMLVSNFRRSQDTLGTASARCTFLHAGAPARSPRLFAWDECHSVVLNADGSSWVRGATTLYQLGPDGIERRRLQFGTQETVREITGYPDGGVLVRSQASAGAPWRLSRIDKNGGRLWQRTEAIAARIAAVADGGAYVAVSTDNELSVTRVDAAGNTLWSRGSLPTDNFVMQLATTADGALYVVSGRTSFMAPWPTDLLRVAGDGTQWWDRPFCEQAQAQVFDTVLVDSNGNSAVTCNDEDAILLRRGADGSTLARVVLPMGNKLGNKLQLSALPGGGLRLLGQNGLSAARLIDIDHEHRLRPTTAEGATDAAPQSLYAGAIDSDGASYLLTAQTLSKVSADGHPLWRANSPNFVLNNATLSVADGQVCARLFNSVSPGNGNSHRYTLRCLDSTTGAPLWREDTPPSTGGEESAAITALEGGNSLALSASPGRYTLDLRDRDGRLLRRVEGSGRAERAYIDRNGRAYIVQRGSLLHYGADGQLRYRSATLPTEPTAITSDEDGTAYLYGRKDQDGNLWSVDSNGVTRWLISTPPPVDAGRLLTRDDAVYLGQSRRLSRFAAASGQLHWRHDTLDPYGRFALNAAGTALVQVYSKGDRLHFERLDAASGNVLGERFAACDFDCGQPAGLSLDTDGSARVLFTGFDHGGETAVAMALPGIAGDSARIAAGQPGIAGAWGALYANGEGIALDWLPDSRTLFGAWFTYRAEGGNDPAGLRWYTLQANGVAAGVRELDLAILVTEQGQFAAGPPVAPRQVGTATLSFIDCDNGTLRYDFDASVNDGRSGVITLSRLSPATQPCLLADGSSQPASGARPPSKGFDARQSGNWYAPATGGQGLQFTVQPEGVFFAPWFTFDRADAGNDTGRQHWFTLQGDLATAINGQVELLLVQTIGGAFDRVPTYNASAIGTATLRMQSCERAELDYRYHDDIAAGPFRARSGTLRLQRAGGCAP